MHIEYMTSGFAPVCSLISTPTPFFCFVAASEIFIPTSSKGNQGSTARSKDLFPGMFVSGYVQVCSSVQAKSNNFLPRISCNFVMFCDAVHSVQEVVLELISISVLLFSIF